MRCCDKCYQIPEQILHTSQSSLVNSKIKKIKRVKYIQIIIIVRFDTFMIQFFFSEVVIPLAIDDKTTEKIKMFTDHLVQSDNRERSYEAADYLAVGKLLETNNCWAS